MSASNNDFPGRAVPSSHGDLVDANGRASVRQRNPNLHVVAAEPAESAVLSGTSKGSHRIEGIGIGFVPPAWKPAFVNELQSATTEEAMQICRRLAREEGLFVGVSSGANVLAALTLAQTVPRDSVIITMLCDGGERYMSEPFWSL